MSSATATCSDVERLRDELQQQIQHCNLELPLLPHVASRVLTMSSDDKTNAAALSELIHQDQALASHVLRIANSAAFGGRASIVSLQQAVARLGLELLTSMALAVSVKNGLFRLRGYESEVQMMWRSALTTGLFARDIARLRRRDSETAFLCGLLQRIGSPVVLRSASAVIVKLGLQLERAQVMAVVDELGTRAGSLLAVKWGLPRPVVEAIVYNDGRRGTPTFRDDVLTGYLAGQLATLALTPGSTLDDLADNPTAPELSLYPDDVAKVFARKDEIANAVEAIS